MPLPTSAESSAVHGSTASPAIRCSIDLDGPVLETTALTPST